MRALIIAKTYPELSAHHQETVCTGAVSEAGSPLRLYPVPFRYLQGDQQYRLWDWIEVDAQRNPSDQRPESRKIVPESVRLAGHVASNAADGWHARRAVVFADPAWQFGSVEALVAAQDATRRSMGIVVPGRIDDVVRRPRPATERDAYAAKAAAVRAQTDLFRPEFLGLDFIATELCIEFRCTDTCTQCANRPHRMKVLDWGLQELARREGVDAAHARLAEITTLARYDFRLFMGNFRLYPKTFGVIGLWYPKHAAQPRLL